MRRAGAGSSSSSSPLLTVDRALGTAAALGVSVAAYRTVRRLIDERRQKYDDERAPKSGEEEDRRRRPPGLAALPPFLSDLLNIVARTILAALRLKHGTRALDDGDGDAYFRAAHRGGRIKRGDDSDDAENDDDSDGKLPLVRHRGSCHCGAVRFTLLAPPSLPSLDCPGKIRYPHHATTADRFELLGEGSEGHLKVYYVALNGDDGSGAAAVGGGGGGGAEGRGGSDTVAAHAFCDLCGVHVLRAPDASTDDLEVNAGCVDDADSDDGPPAVGNRGAPEVLLGRRVRYYENARGGMGAGVPLLPSFAPPPEAERVNHDGEGGPPTLTEDGSEDRSSVQFESAVRNVFGITDSRHGRWSQSFGGERLPSELSGEEGDDDAAALSVRESAGANWADRTGWSSNDDEKLTRQETPTTSATSASGDMLSLRGLGVAGHGGALLPTRPPQMATLAASEDAMTPGMSPGGFGGEDTTPAGDVSSIGDYSATHHWRGDDSPRAIPREDGDDDAKTAPVPSSSTNAEQLRYFMKRHVAASTSGSSSLSAPRSNP